MISNVLFRLLKHQIHAKCYYTHSASMKNPSLAIYEDLWPHVILNSELNLSTTAIT